MNTASVVYPENANLSVSKIALLVLYAFFFLSPYALSSQLPILNIPFAPLDIPDVAKTENVRVVFQDSKRLIWIGIENGVIKYDGFRSTSFLYDPTKKNSLSNENITDIIEDKNGDIWVATDNGFNKLVKRNGSFVHYLRNNNTGDIELYNRIFDLFVDSKQRIWVASETGILVYEEEFDSFRKITPWNKDYAYEGLEIWPQHFMEDELGFLWISTSGGGLIHFDAEKETFTHYSSSTLNKNKIPNDFISVSRVHTSDTLLLGTDFGLYEFDHKNKTSLQILPKKLAKRITHLEKDNSGNWWLISGESLYKLSPELDSAYKYDLNNGLSENPILKKAYSFFIDDENSIWLSMVDAGLHFSSQSLNRIKRVKFSDSAYKNNLVKITSLGKQNEQLLIGAQEKLFTLDPISNLFQEAKFVYSKSDAKQGNVNHIQFSNDGKIWAATDSGLAVSNSFDEFKVTQFLANMNSMHQSSFSSIAIDPYGDAWLSEQMMGLIKYDSRTGEFQVMNKHLNFGADIRRQHLFFNRKIEKLVIADYSKGLFLFDVNTMKMTKVKNTNSQLSLINAQYKEPNKIMMFYGKNESIQIDLTTSKIFDLDLPINNVGCMLEDNYGIIWLAQRKGGLFSWNKHNKKLRQFRESDGVPQLGLTGKDCIKMSNGDLLFGSYEGLLYKELRQSLVSKIKPISIISEVEIKNRKYSLIDIENLKVDPYYSKNSIELEHGESPVSISFSTSSYLDTKNNQYKYRLRGISDEWIHVDKNLHSVSFSFLPEGTYIFEVYASNADGIWSEKPAIFRFAVRPPMWFTWWAILCYVFAVLLVIYYVFRLRTVAIRNRGKQLEDLVKERTQALSHEKFIVEKLLSQKNEEIANISHEFRTPLTLILGPIQNLLRSNLRSTTRHKLRMVKRNGFRLLRMVDQLLNIERFKIQKLAATEIQAIKPIVSLIGQSFQELSKEKNIIFLIKHIDEAWISFTPDAIEKIVLNLLSNAIKYTMEDGIITLTVSLRKDSKLEIQVKDTGVGIPKDKQVDIFKRYHRVENEYGDGVLGAGIGLALVKELVEAHKGTIELKSDVDVGSIFTVTFPNAFSKPPLEKHEKTNTKLLEIELENIRGQYDAYNDKAERKHLKPNLSYIGNKSTLLIIEDNLDMREYIVDSLSEQYYCLTANNGKEGVALAFESIPDLIISDIMMPVMDGYELVHILKEDERTSHIPVVLLTARGDKVSRIKGWKGYIDEYLTKPFDVDELIVRIENLISIRNLLRRRFSMQAVNGSCIDELKNIGLNQKDKNFVNKINDIFEKYYSKSDLETKDIASKLAMSERQLQRKLKAVIDFSPRDYLRVYRLNKSKTLLQDGLRIGDISFEIGFTSQAYFSKCFKIQFGITAKQYQYQCQNNIS